MAFGDLVIVLRAVAVAVGDGKASVFAEGFGRDLDAGRCLASFVFAAVDHAHDVFHDRGVERDPPYPRNRLEYRQVFRQLELAYVRAVIIPLDLLVCNKFLEYVVAQGITHKRALLGFR